MEGRPIRETVLLYGLGTLWGVLDNNMSESAHVRDRRTPHIHPDPFLPCLRGGVTGQPKSTLLCRPCSKTRWCHYALAGGEGRASTFASRVTWHRADENPTEKRKRRGLAPWSAPHHLREKRAAASFTPRQLGVPNTRPTPGPHKHALEGLCSFLISL